MVGAKEGDSLTADFLRTYFLVLTITQEIAEQAVSLRRKNRIKLPDALIQATAQKHNALLVTRNTRDFPPKL